MLAHVAGLTVEEVVVVLGTTGAGAVLVTLRAVLTRVTGRPRSD